MKLGTISRILGMIAVMSVCGTNLLAQNENGGGAGGDFDPVQFRQHLIEQIRQKLDVTNKDEWPVIQPLVQKVLDARREVGRGGGMGMGGPPGPPPGAGQEGPSPSGGPGRFGPPQSEDQKALQKVIDAKLGGSQIKKALATYRATQSEKQARLETAQGNLKSVLTIRQEAASLLIGLLE